MANPHCIAWAMATVRVFVHSGKSTGPLVPASDHVPCRLRWRGHAVFPDRKMSIPITRDGYDPEVRFFVRGAEIPGLKVEWPGYIVAGNTAELSS